ncbi:hypothetical protein K7X08_017190 [Anisodus acutangulus]|uniref:Uncharacterized protein n=1 Tax=Anisodus acutangulus TaxID=402998 RepID=A0A9Q1LRY8_9SOLA|nr:hypothetical protein K7X08_017190 [Anisodus acutangulus]
MAEEVSSALPDKSSSLAKDYHEPPPAPFIGVAELKKWAKIDDPCSGVRLLGIAWAFGGMVFVLVYCTAGISVQYLGAICGVALVKDMYKSNYELYGGGVNLISPGYSKGIAWSAEIIGTFVLVYTVLSATDSKRNARDSHVPVLAPLPIGFAVFLVHLATIPITGTEINPARSLGTAVIYNKHMAWKDLVSPHPILSLVQ